MGRRKKTVEVADGQGDLMEHRLPEHDKLVKLVRKLKKKRDERNNVLTTMKAAEDAAAEQVVVEMKALGLTEFFGSGLEVEIFEGKTKVVVKDHSPGSDDGGGAD